MCYFCFLYFLTILHTGFHNDSTGLQLICSVQNFFFFMLMSILVISLLFAISYPKRCEGVSHHCFNLHLNNDCSCCASFYNIYLLAICMYLKKSIWSFLCFLTELLLLSLLFLPLIYMSFLCILGIKLLSDVWFVHVFFHIL